MIRVNAGMRTTFKLRVGISNMTLYIEKNDPNRVFFKNLRDIVKTDQGYTLQNVYQESTDDQLVSTSEHDSITCSNEYSRNCYRCTQCSGDYCTLRQKLENLPDDNFLVPFNTVAHCDAYDPVVPLNIIESEDDMITFIERAKNFFSGIEKYEDYFGFERLYDESDGRILETVREYYNRGGKFTAIPDKYPCVVYFGVVDFNGERGHDEKLDWIPITNEQEK